MNIIITGATSGIGQATAEQILKLQPDAALWLIGRRLDRLEHFKKNHPEANIHIDTVDVRDNNQVSEWSEKVKKDWGYVDVLVNNAGLALGVSAIDEGNLEDWNTMIDTNIKGLLYVTKAITPLMIGQKKGHIINIGSTAGKMAYANGNVYCATKYAVDALGQTMRIDLLRHNIKVTNINPGMVETEFSLVRLKGDSDAAKKVYEGYQPLVAADVASVIYYAITLPAHVCINDLTVTCTQQANSIYKTQF